MNNKVEKLKVAILTTSVREGRVGLDVANWVLKNAQEKNNNMTYEIVDIKNYALPVFGTAASEEQQLAVKAWSDKLSEFDAYIFAAAEYNHSYTGTIKNAFDFVKPEVANKVAGFAGYGSVGGARAVEALRLMLAELSVAGVQRNLGFLLAYDFENYSVFKPQAYHSGLLAEMLGQIEMWAGALKNARN